METSLKIRKIFKKKLKNLFPVFGTWTSIGDVQNTDMLLNANLDFHGIDLEHSTINLNQITQILNSCIKNSIICLARMASHNEENIRRVLDIGVDGLIIPNVCSSSQVKNILKSMKYPPIGERGYGIAKAQNYGHNFSTYVKNWNRSSLLFIQIESIEAVNDVEEIINFREIDGVLIGPYDISGSLGIPGQIHNRKVTQASNKIIKACKKYKKSCGIHLVNVSKKNIKKILLQGFNILTLSSDVFIFKDWTENISSIIKKI